MLAIVTINPCNRTVLSFPLKRNIMLLEITFLQSGSGYTQF